jgi:hypothetical protein
LVSDVLPFFVINKYIRILRRTLIASVLVPQPPYTTGG